jgi:UDP-N-acetylmuramate--alanine ligase
VVEADESDASFLHLHPVAAVVTNIDADHMETYGHSLDRLRQTFVDFLQQLPFYGVAVLCIDDVNIQAILPSVAKPVLTYGFDPAAQIRAVAVEHRAGRMRFRVERRLDRRRGDVLPDLEIELNLPGEHNVLNALAAIAIGVEVGAGDEAIVRALREFRGVGRRFQRYADIGLDSGGSAGLIDDYGHHPVEMAATLAAVRGAYPDRRVVLAFQPHRYTRTRDLFEDFVRVLSTVDVLLLTEVYPAGEAPIVAADGRALARALRVHGKVEPIFVEQVNELPAAIRAAARDRDVVVTMGAGSIGYVPVWLHSAREGMQSR